jgi:uncharacterized protein YndB with AHSA1/START domain
MNQNSITHSTFTINRSYPKAPAKVFAAFADPVKKRRWFAEGEGFILDSYTADFRVGGHEHSRFRFVGEAPIEKGTPMGNDTWYQDIQTDRRIVFSYSMSMADKPFSASLATVELFPTAQGTDLLFTEQSAFFEGSDGAQVREAGWRQLLELLANELEQY